MFQIHDQMLWRQNWKRIQKAELITSVSKGIAHQEYQRLQMGKNLCYNRENRIFYSRDFTKNYWNYYNLEK